MHQNVTCMYIHANVDCTCICYGPFTWLNFGVLGKAHLQRRACTNIHMSNTHMHTHDFNIPSISSHIYWSSHPTHPLLLLLSPTLPTPPTSTPLTPTPHTHTQLCTYTRWVQELFQSGWKEAPISTAFSLSSARNGFLNPLRENTTPLYLAGRNTCQQAHTYTYGVHITHTIMPSFSLLADETVWKKFKPAKTQFTHKEIQCT